MKGMSISISYVVTFVLLIILLVSVTMMLKGQVNSQKAFLENSIGVLIE